MSHRFCQTITGYCPLIDAERSIEATYTEIPIMNAKLPTYKVSGYDCNDYEECQERYCSIAQEHATL